MFWPTASALGLLDAESKNFFFVLQGHCDLHVKCCRRMQPDVTGFSKVRMVDLDGFKQCKLGLRDVNFAPVQTFFIGLRGWDDGSWKTRTNQKKKAKLATQVGHTSGRRFTKQLPSYNKRKLCRKKKCRENITQCCSMFSKEEPFCKGWSSRISWDSYVVCTRRLFNPPKRCHDFFGRRPEHGHGKTIQRMDSQTSPHPTMETSIGARLAHQFRCPNLTSMEDLLLELIVNHSSHKCDPPSRCRSTSISNARASSMSLHVESLTCTQLDQKWNSSYHHKQTSRGKARLPSHTLTVKFSFEVFSDLLRLFGSLGVFSSLDIFGVFQTFRSSDSFVFILGCCSKHKPMLLPHRSLHGKCWFGGAEWLQGWISGNSAECKKKLVEKGTIWWNHSIYNVI